MKKITFHLFCCGSHVDKNFGNKLMKLKKINFQMYIHSKL